MNNRFPKIIYAAATIILAVLVFRFSTNGDIANASMFVYPHTYQKGIINKQDKSFETLKNLDDALAKIAKTTNPTVVTIFVRKEIKGKQVPMNMGPFQQFFGNGFQMQQPPQVEQGMGSGIIVSKDGYILTNNHVVSHADSIMVRIYGGKELPAKVIGTDPETDLAVVKVNAKNLPVIHFGNSDNLKVGQIVMAVGSPLDRGLHNTVTMGIVSAKGRDNLHLASYEDFIQTDAAINPGNSGGPLVNLYGQLVGINSAIATESGGYQGIGFAIPVNMAKWVMDSIIKYGKVKRGELGVEISQMDDLMAQAFDIKDDKGALVQSVSPGGPAAKAGLKKGDIIIKLNGKEMDSANELRNQIASTKPGTEVTVTVLRDGKDKQYTVKLGELNSKGTEMGRSSSGKSAQDLLNFSVGNITNSNAQKYRIPDNTEGVVVTNIDHHGSAYQSGLQEGDVINAVNRKPVRNVDDFDNAIKGIHKGSVVLLRVTRQNNSFFMAFKIY